MGEHGLYWQDQAKAGAAIVVGAVLDPAGVWGVAIVEADTVEAARRLTEADPVIRAACGFRYDIFPMPQVILRQT